MFIQQSDFAWPFLLIYRRIKQPDILIRFRKLKTRPTFGNSHKTLEISSIIKLTRQ